MNKLFICSFGEIRSPTAVNLFGGEYLEKGLNGASPKTIRRLCKKADIIFIFEAFHRWFILREYPEFLNKVVSLYVEDIYPKKNDSNLIKILHYRWEKLKQNI